MPNFNRNLLQEAAEQVAGHIRYTQHLAMNDDKFNENNATWWRARWQIHFEDDNIDAGEKIYVIYNNKDYDVNEDDDEMARDPLSGKLMRGANNDLMADPSKYTGELMISKKYGITNVIFSNNCHNAASPITSNRLGFDNLGRPYFHTANAAPFDDMLTADCLITLVHPDGNATITVRPQTGYVSISYP